MKRLPFHNSPVLKNQYPIWRGRVVLLLLGGAFFALALRALYLQGITTEFLVNQGVSRYERTLVLHASRGKILDRNGVVLAAISQCPSGHVEFGVYAAGSQFASCGLISGGGMTREAALGKLFALLAAGMSQSEVEHWFALDLCGELLEG